MIRLLPLLGNPVDVQSRCAESMCTVVGKLVLVRHP